jgi:alginate O-acetyltransferase complex protein AlgJ
VAERLNQAREEQARRELAHTDVAEGLARVLVAVFLLSIASVGVIQHLGALAGPGEEGIAGTTAAAPLRWKALLMEAPTDCSLEAFERDLEGALVVGRWMLPGIQWFLTRVFGVGNEQVYSGRQRWLFHRAGIDYLSGPPFLDPARLRARRSDADRCEPLPDPDPIPAILRFDEDLSARGIRLVVVPTPAKAVIHPDGFSGRFAPRAPPVQNPSFHDFLVRLESAGVLVFDPTPLLRSFEEENGQSAFLATDTHWRPQAMAAVAEGLAAVVQQRVALSERQAPRYTRGLLEVSNFGDLVTMLSLPASQNFFSPERVTIQPVRGFDRALWQPDPGAEILLLGDSFSNVYSNREAFANRVAGREYHWGEGAGLAEQLSFFLQRPVDRIVRNAGGSHSTRRELERSIARGAQTGRDRLRRVRVVIYQFAVRELAAGDWQEIPLYPETTTATRRTPGEPASVRGQGHSVIRGTIAARTTLPRPYTVPYKDCLFAVHLKGVRARAGGPVAEEVISYLWGMRDNVWTDAAVFRVGDQVTLRVRPWEEPEVQQRYGTYNRKELDDPELLALPAFWGEPQE